MKASELGGCFWEAFEPAEMMQHVIEDETRAQSNMGGTGFTATLRRGGIEHKALFKCAQLVSY